MVLIQFFNEKNNQNTINMNFCFRINYFILKIQIL